MRVLRSTFAFLVAVGLLVSAAVSPGAAGSLPSLPKAPTSPICSIIEFLEAQFASNPIVMAQLDIVENQFCAPTPTGIVLNAPTAGATIQQDNPAAGCTYDPARGYGFTVHFDWTAPSINNVASYELVLQHGSATPALDVTVTATNYTDTECNSFVIDNNLSGWHWQVTALNSSNQVLADSGPRTISFGPCRLQDASTPCHT